MKFIIDEKLAQAILDYLIQKPYREVAALINDILRLERVKEDKE